MAGNREARTRITGDSRRLDSVLGTARKKFDRFGKAVKKDVGRSFRSLRQSLATIAGFAGVGGFTLAGQQVKDFETKLTRLQIAADQTPASMAKTRDQVRGLADSWGVASDDILSGLAKFVERTGDFDQGVASLEAMTKVSAATGSAMTDVAATAAALRDNLKIDGSDMERAFSILIEQGKAGSVELRDLSTLMAGLSPQFAQFAGGRGVEGMANIGAVMQALAKGFGTAEEASTGFRAMMGSVVKQAARFEEAGVKVFVENPRTGQKEARNFLDIMDDIAGSKLAKDPERLAKAFGREEALRAFIQYQDNRDLIRELTADLESAAALNKDATTFRDSGAGKFARAMERFKNVVAKVLTPERIEALGRAMGKLADAMGFLADHAGLALAVFAGAKFGPTFWVEMSKGTDRFAKALRGVNKVMGSLTAAVPTFFAGWEFGKLIDGATGLSDALAGIEAQNSSDMDPFERRVHRDTIRSFQHRGMSPEESVQTLMDAMRRDGVDERTIAQKINGLVIKDANNVPIVADFANGSTNIRRRDKGGGGLLDRIRQKVDVVVRVSDDRVTAEVQERRNP